MARTITAKQVVFAREYALHRNATQAALEAGYSPHTASAQGYQLLQKPLVIAEIQRHEAEAVQIYEISRDAILQGHAKIANMPPAGLPSYTDIRGSLDSMAKIGGFVVDQHVVVGATFEEFRDSMNAERAKNIRDKSIEVSHLEIVPEEVAPDPVVEKPDDRQSRLPIERVDLAPGDAAPVFDDEPAEEPPANTEIDHRPNLGTRPMGFGMPRKKGI